MPRYFIRAGDRAEEIKRSHSDKHSARKWWTIANTEWEQSEKMHNEDAPLAYFTQHLVLTLKSFIINGVTLVQFYAMLLLHT